MEAGGVCAAAARYNIPVSMIRAVSDKADPSKADTQWRTRGMKTIATLVEAIDWHAITGRLKAQ
jgi:nucleoside phosphorylase